MPKPRKGQYLVCVVCGGTYYRPNHAVEGSKYCSRKCKDDDHIEKIEKICVGCSNSFSVYPSEEYLEYCSRNCYDSSRLSASIGTRKTNSDGYVLVKHPDNPMAQPSTGFVFEHRLVMGEALGRPLFPHETPHHKNGVRDNNDISNLELWSTSQPAGQRVQDKIDWAVNFLSQYGKIDFVQELAVQNPSAVVVGEFG